MKKIKPQINSYCPFCKAEGQEKVRATWRGDYLTDRACDAHKDKLRSALPEQEPSEADYQTWMRL